jgi:hypothetical protein
VTFKFAVNAAQSFQVLNGKRSRFSPDGVKQWRCVTFGEDEAVIEGVVWVGDIVAKCCEEKGGNDIGCRQTSRWVSRPSKGRRFNRMSPQKLPHRFQSLNKFLPLHHFSHLFSPLPWSCL